MVSGRKSSWYGKDRVGLQADAGGTGQFGPQLAALRTTTFAQKRTFTQTDQKISKWQPGWLVNL